MLVERQWRGWTLPMQRLLAGGPEKNPHAPPRPYRQDHLANLQAAVASTLMDSLAENLQARRERAQAYRCLLGDLSGVALILHQPGSACLAQVIRVVSNGRDADGAARIIHRLGEAGFEVQGSYVPIHLLGGLPCCVWDRLPRTEKIWADLVELPCEPKVSLDHVEQIAMVIKTGLAH